MAKNTTTTLASLFSDLEESKKKEVRLIVKADASGSLEVLPWATSPAKSEDQPDPLRRWSGDQHRQPRQASGAIIAFGFHVIADGRARREAEGKGVDTKSSTNCWMR